MLNHRHTASGRTIPGMVAALALLGAGVVWLLTRGGPARALPSRGPRGPRGVAPRPAAAAQWPEATEPQWASVAGEEDPGASVEPPSAATPSEGRE
jgi:hypothetical protein